jgi:hypothetical protein
VAVSEGGASASHATSSSWGLAIADTWFNEGVHEITLPTQCDNLSLFVGVCRRKYADDAAAAVAADEEIGLPRDSEDAICMHGDGRVFIRGSEKDWGLMTLKSDSSLVLVLDFETGVVTFKLERMVRGKRKETEAAIPGLFAEATLCVAFGGRDQGLELGSIERLASAGEGKRVRDAFTEAMGSFVAPLTLKAERPAGSVSSQEAAVAATMAE